MRCWRIAVSRAGIKNDAVGDSGTEVVPFPEHRLDAARQGGARAARARHCAVGAVAGLFVTRENHKVFLPGAGILAGTLSGLRQVATRHTGGDSDNVFLGINLAGTSTAAQRG